MQRTQIAMGILATALGALALGGGMRHLAHTPPSEAAASAAAARAVEARTGGTDFRTAGMPRKPGPRFAKADASPPPSASSPSPSNLNPIPNPRNPDDAADLGRRLDRAIAEARRDRSLAIDPTLLPPARRNDPVRIVFRLRNPPSERSAEALASMVEDANDTKMRLYPAFDQAAAQVDGEGLLRLVASGLTDRIERDRLHRPLLDSTRAVIGADALHIEGLEGQGRTLAVLDTGVDATHPLLSARLVEEACFSILADCPDGTTRMVGPGAAAPCPDAGCEHGTTVAGVALAGDASRARVGLAPAAQLIAIQVFSFVDPEIGAYTSDILAGLQHVLALAPFYSIDAVNLSFGSEQYSDTASCQANGGAIASATATLRAAGISTVASSGNDGRIDAIRSPACLPNVLAVGATTDADRIPAYSNTSELVSLLAPGTAVETTRVGGGTTVVGGTSIATPHVSGALALLRQAHPTATPDELQNALVLSGVPVYRADADVTIPRLDVEAALALLDSAAASGSGVPSPGGGTGTGRPASPATASAGSSGGACGLVGLEPFGVLLLTRWCRIGGRSPHRRRSTVTEPTRAA